MAKTTKRKPSTVAAKAKPDHAEARAKGKPTLEPSPLNTPETRKRHPGGRPPEYDRAYCEQVVEWGRQGKSKTWIAATLEVDRDTIYEWAKQHKEFSDALTRAKVLEQRWWEDVGQQNLTTSGFAQTMWGRSMAARFPDEWRETSRQEIGGKDGGALKIDVGSASVLETARWIADRLTAATVLPVIIDETEGSS